MYVQVKYELQEIEHLITAGHQEQADEKVISLTRDVIRLEVERIKKTFVQEVFSFDDERHLERYIQYHQQAIIRLMDRVSADKTALKARTDAYSQLYYLSLEEILEFIERHFTRYFDQDAKAPESYIALASKIAQRNLRKLKRQLFKRAVSVEMVDLILCAVRRITKREPETIVTYRKVIYSNLVQKELFRILDKTDVADINAELRQLIKYLNYNADRIVAYFIRYLGTLVDENDSRQERIEKLSLELKNLNQSQVKPGVIYNHTSPNLKELLNSFLVEEIDYLTRVQELFPGYPQKSSDSIMLSFKLKVDSSVSQLAFLTRVFMEIQFIQNKNLADVLRFVSRFFITKRAEGISFDSLRAKYYNAESGTRDAVRSILISMINHIEKN